MTDALAYSRFIVLGQGRTGSTLLVQALNSHPAIVGFGEIFNFSEFLNADAEPVQFNIAGWSTDQAADRALRSSDYQRFLRERVFCNHEPLVRAVGFKFHYEHVWGNDPSLAGYLAADKDLRVIHLTRRNRLRTLVSKNLALKTGRWLEYEKPGAQTTSESTIKRWRKRVRSTLASLRSNNAADQGGAERRLTISPGELREFCATTDAQEREWAERMSNHPLLTFAYEDLAADMDTWFANAQRFLGVEPLLLTTRMRRQNPEPLRQLITNYNDLRAAFAGTQEEHYFDD